MPYLRQRPRIMPNGRIAVRLTPAQRDFVIRAPEMPKGLGHGLHRAAVREGKLTVRVTREELDALIMVAAAIRVPDRNTEKELAVFLRYLESLADRFAEPEEEEGRSPSGGA